jgi:malonyl-CoA O-methyltransferase
MNSPYRRRIESAFAGARDYDRHALVQHKVAAALADRIAALALPAHPRILEIGCGTGFLTQALIERGIDGEMLITDIAAEMVARCRRRVGATATREFAVLDGEYGEPEHGGRFDLICSSLALQWFDDQAAALPRMLSWLRPGGHCVFATLGAGSFAEWREAHEKEGLVPGTPRFATLAELAAMAPLSQVRAPAAAYFVEDHESGLEFIRALRAIGAHTARRTHRPLSPAALRRVIRNFEASGATVTYEVVTCQYGDGPSAR